MNTNAYSKYLGPEDLLQIEVCNYIKWKYRGAVIHHSPNRGKRTPFEQYKLKALHTSAGFPDLFIVHKGKAFCIELKAKGGKATELQRIWIETLNRNGIPARVCVGYDESVAFIDEQLS